MQRKLRRLAHGADEQADANHCDQHPASAREVQSTKFVRFREDFTVIQGACVCGDQTDTQNESKVTNPIHQKSLHVGKNGRRLVEPETNQKIGDQSYCFPTEEQLQQVVAHDQHEHGESEQRNVGKEAVVAVVFFHVTDGVDVNHQRHKSNHDHHHGGQAVNQKAHFHLEATNHHPCVQRLVETRAVQCNALERHGRENKGNQHTQDRQRVAEATPNPVAAKGCTEYASQQSARQRSQRNSQER